MSLNFDFGKLEQGLTDFERKTKKALLAYGNVAGKKLEAWAKDPPYPEKPETTYTDKEMILFKTLAKRKKLKVKIKKGNASGHFRWKDRTGHARQTIQGGAEVTGDKTYIYVAGNKEYSPYLEFAHEKQYAVLWPAIEELSPEIMKGMEKLLEK